MRYVVEGSRHILFDLHLMIRLDFGVLIAWMAVNTALFPLACDFMRWKSKHHVHMYYKWIGGAITLLKTGPKKLQSPKNISQQP